MLYHRYCSAMAYTFSFLDNLPIQVRLSPPSAIEFIFTRYKNRLLTVGFHEMSHALMGVLTCAHIHSIELDPDEGGATSMSGGIQWLTLPAGYLGSSFIGACLIACGFNTNASKVASLVLAVFFLFTLWWARRNWLTWALILGMSGLIVLFWFVADSVALRYFVLFIGVMSCMYVLWDVIDDTIARKVNTSDASAFAKVCGCFPSQGTFPFIAGA
ncbi:peptidase M50B-like-domain-containing protein [Armillaria borealis]|uniref:Peptidase M50B-like-domain-containing protein n=1 Tax=Armillaria borealis TaxID=47425 RepID=A0AA39JLZ6_9AGAR|nr:peptidase M50B-like-domain-containing protein [Armillaria borealis]